MTPFRRCGTIIVVAFVLAVYGVPLILREAILKCGIRLNGYLNRTDIPMACPRFEQVTHESVLQAFDYKRYRGTWYTFAHNDPTQPKGRCSCDRFFWDLREPDAFWARLDVVCTLHSSTVAPFTMWLNGKTNSSGQKASMLEGAPWMGAGLIPNYVIWVDSKYEACIRYSCQERYLGVPLFSSLQIWTRTPLKPDSKKGKLLLKQAHKLVNFSDEYIEFGHHHDCVLLPTLPLQSE